MGQSWNESEQDALRAFHGRSGIALTPATEVERWRRRFWWAMLVAFALLMWKIA